MAVNVGRLSRWPTPCPSLIEPDLVVDLIIVEYRFHKQETGSLSLSPSVLSLGLGERTTAFGYL